ncbi:MAG TPA: hypothetical protein DDY78_06245 [Planctomycetales bacterium]|jgi:hypothetical protein|nr:hypothetical protein [Planctomycetales bacterium]
MIQKDTFEWTAAKEQAARLVAEGVLTEAQIGKAAGVLRCQVQRWKRNPAFAERVRFILAELGEVSRQRSIGRREVRMEAIQERWFMLRKAIAEREGDLATVDMAALLKAALDHEKQAAIESGQWTEKREVGGAAPMIRLVEVVRPAKPGEACTVERSPSAY